jgi:cobyrinic acid a,c-diamide synthase
MNQRIPRILLAGTNSGCGKTTVTCAVLQALVDRGLRVGAFKCGPDYIDPMFHRRITGARSANLDPFFFDENTLRTLLARNGADREISVVEGVMGYYDGIGMTPEASTYRVAQATESPVVLVVNARGAALSALAVAAGFLTLYPDNHIAGVIFNQCAEKTYRALAEELQQRLGLRPLGYLPRMTGAALESRHLGLVTADEVRDLKEKMHALALQAEKTVDLDGLLALADGASPVTWEEAPLPRLERVRIAVARDRAFCFYYEDSLDLLRRMGAELVDFSPLEDPVLPEDIHGLYLGGGYPELYAAELSANESMRRSVCRALERGLPCIAECGGFMYLNETVGGLPMAGFLKGRCTDAGRLTRFGYVTLRAREDNLLCRAGEEIPAHEFHYWDCTRPGDGFTAVKPDGRTWTCAVSTPRLYAGYPHFHFCANPAFARHFYETCIEEKHSHD